MHGRLLHPKLRGLGGAERLMYHYSKAHPRHFCIVAQIKAKRSADDYRRTLRAVQWRHQLLRSGIGEDALQGPFFFGVAMAEPLMLSRVSQFAWVDRVKTELETNFEDGGGLFRAVVLHDDVGADFVLTFHHAIADGMSGTAIAEDLMKALAGRALEPLGVPSSLENFNSLYHGMELPDDLRGPSLLGDRAMMLAQADRPLWRQFENDSVSISTATIEADVIGVLRQLCREMGTTVNSAICTAIALVGCKVENRSEYKILSAIDVRPILDLDYERCALRAVAATHSIHKPDTEDFWIAARAHSEMVKGSREKARIVETSRMLDRLIPPTCDPRIASGLLGSLGYDAVVSNLGNLSIRLRIDDVQLSALWGPVGQARLKSERFLGVATTRNVMRMLEATPTYQRPLLSDLKQCLVDIVRPR